MGDSVSGEVAVEPGVPVALARTDPVTAAELDFWLGARRSGLERLAQIWREGSRSPSIAQPYGQALVVLGRFDEAVDVTIEAARTAPASWLERSTASIPLLCHPIPGHAATRLGRDRVVRRRLSKSHFAGIEMMTGPVVSAACLAVWWRLGRATSMGAVSGSLWAAASLAAMRADDADRAVAAERRASFADPAAPLLAIARSSLGLRSVPVDPCFESDIRARQAIRPNALGDAADYRSAVRAALTGDPDNPVLLLRALAYDTLTSDQMDAGSDVTSTVDTIRALIDRADLVGLIRTDVLNLLGCVLAVEAATHHRTPHPDAMACADLLVASPIPPGVPWHYRDTAALVHATSGDLPTAEELLSGEHLEHEPADTQASVALTRAHIAYRRGDLNTSRDLLQTAWPRMHTRSHARSLALQLGIRDG